MSSSLVRQLSLAARMLQEGQLLQAQAQCQQILSQFPGAAEAQHLLGLVHAKAGNHEQAAHLLGNAVRKQPMVPALRNNLGIALKKLGRLDEARSEFERAIALRPDYVEAHNNLGSALLDAGSLPQALKCLDRAIALRGDHAPAHNNRGCVLLALERPDEALACFLRALQANPDHAEAANNRADALRQLGRLEQALEASEQALAIQPDLAAAHGNRGAVLAQMRRWAEAIAAFDAALALAPADAGVHCNRGNALLAVHRLDEAMASFHRAIEIDPGLDDARAALGEACLRARRHRDAADAFAQLVAANPGYPYALGNLLHARMLCCDWQELEPLRKQVSAGLAAGAEVVEPFVLQGISGSEAELRRCAEVFAAAQFPPQPTLARPKPASPQDSRIVIGYLCGEFRQQATSILMCGVFEQHDRSRFLLLAFDNGGGDGSSHRRRIEAAFEEIIDIRGRSDREAAELIRDLGVDVLVNLNGYFGDGRQGVFAHRPAAIQVNYLGFPGTLGAEYIDYLIADATVIPAQDREHYIEKIVYLPGCYQANDAGRAASTRPVTRAGAGLPDDAFVYCCFNNSYKITPPTFDGWLRILAQVEGSVLWLLQPDAAAVANLRREAGRRGIDGSRLLFAPHVPPDEHLARHALADLFLDTLPYNAHTTGSDALWSGLPVLTRIGSTFAGRVGASLLRTIGLPELITTTEAQYEALAVALAGDRNRLAALRSRLQSGAAGSPLFDTPRFTMQLEAAYALMVERQREGLPPEHLSISPPAR